MSLKKSLKWIVLLAAMVTVGTLIILNRRWIGDWWRGMSYESSSEMAMIRDKLNLTEKGSFLFNASQPVLKEKEEFNKYCKTSEETEVAVLGCYTEDEIYIYNITAEELEGIRELTTAHELLHAVWARMSDKEKRELVGSLAQTFEKNQALLGGEIDSYDINQKQEELYVRAGTEIKDLPGDLEKHYGEIFINQDSIVNYYESYIGVFNRMKKEMDDLMVEIEGIQTQIDTLSNTYESRLVQLNARIEEFNGCAGRAGCFSNEAQFYSQRNELIGEQNSLMELYNEISWLVDEYNVRVERYNEDVVHSNRLNGIINSNMKPEMVE